MKKIEVQRIYNFPDGNLVTIGKEKIAFMRRDISAFRSFGISETNFNALETALNSFSETITDIEALNVQVESTVLKDGKAEEVRTAIRAIMTRVDLKFGTTSARYKKFGTEALAQQSDSELLVIAKRVVRVGTEYLSDLAENGLTEIMLSDLSHLKDAFETLLVDQKLKIGDRDILQEDRVEEGNTIYKTLSSYTSTGMSIWVSSDVAKYNDYIIYNTPSGTAAIEPTV